jgi:hypothetical protein
MKKQLTILSMATVMAGAAWADHVNTELHNSDPRSTLTLRMTERKSELPIGGSGIWKLSCREGVCRRIP